MPVMRGEGFRLVLLYLCACLSYASLEDTAHGDVKKLAEAWEGYSCDRLKDVPESQRCQFVTEECRSDSRVPYTEWYYCSVAPYGVFATGGFMMLLACVLPLLFCLLGNTAELYFSPTMSLVSQTIPKMRPRFAGVTFVAMGNGAPDLSANISAIRSGQVALSAGAFTGAAMFVQCVVASEVIRISKGVTCKGAVLRDVGTYAVSITGVGLCLYSGVITHWFVVCAVLVYVVYASWVFAGDEWHAAGRPNLQPDRAAWEDLRAMLLQRGYKRKGGPGAGAGALQVQEQAQYAEALLPWASLEEGDAEGVQAGMLDVEDGGVGGEHSRAQGSTSVRHRQGRSSNGGGGSGGGSASAAGAGHTQRYLDSRAYKEAVWADLEDEPALQPQQPPQQQQHFGHLQAVELQSNSEGEGGGAADKWPRFLTPHPPHTSYEPPSLGDASQQGLNHPRSSKSTGSIRTWTHETGFVRDQGAHGAGSLADQLPSHITPSVQAAADDPTKSAIDCTWGGGGGDADECSRGSHGQGTGAHPGLEAAGELPWGGVGGETEGGMLQGRMALLPGADRRQHYQDHHQHQQQQQQQQQQQGGWEGEGQLSWTGQLWEKVKHELTLGESDEWQELPRWQRVLREVSFKCLLPAYAAQRATIPQVDPASYSQQWLVVSMLCSPLAVLVYFDAYSLGAVMTAMAVGFSLGLGVHILTKDEEGLPTLDLGTSFAFGPAILSLAGFFMGVLWIDTLASEVVGIVSLTSRLLGLPPSLVGLTLLAVGSSLGDFFGNPSMARRGHASTALTACFAGPLFNMLISMAAGFGSFFAREGVTRTQVQFTPDIALGVGCLVIYNIVVASVGLLNNSRIPEKFYLFARAWYAMYIIIACLLGITGLS